jgi:hypothetical protein
MLGILYCGTRSEVNSWNSIPNYFAEEKTTGNRSELLEFRSEPFRRGENNIEAYFLNFVPNHFATENTLSVLFSGTGNSRFESLSQNEAAKNFQKTFQKSYFGCVVN